MDFQECIKFATETNLAYFATNEGDQPRVRPLLLYSADETGFYFRTFSTKNLYKQLQKHKKVEVCFYPPEPKDKAPRVLRVAGEIEFVENEPIQEKMPSLERNKGEKEEPEERRLPPKPKGAKFLTFRIYKGEAYLWTPKYNFRESEFPRVTF